jgi:hypothetical protein
MSTQRKRKEDENIQLAQKAGKSSPDNENYFYNEYNKWLNDGKLDTPFTAEYVEYTDVDKKLRDLGSKLKEDELGIENPYMRDDLGQTLYFSTDPKTGKTVTSTDSSKGERKIDLAMLSVKTKGVSAQKILNNFYDSLDANDKRQLGINSWAHYRGAGPERFREDIVKSYNDKKLLLSQELIDLNVNLKNPNLTSVDKARIQAKIKDVENTISNKVLDKELADDLSELDTKVGLEDFKYKTYTQKYLTNLAKDISYRSYIQEIKTNPLEQADMARKRLQFDVQKEANDRYQWRISETRLQAKDDFEKLKWITENAPSEFKVLPGQVPTDGKPVTDDVLLNDIKIAGEAYQAKRNQWANTLFSGDGMSMNEKVAAFDKLASDYRQNPKMNLTSDQRKYLELDRSAQNDLTIDINLLSSARKKAEETKQNYINNNLIQKTVTAGGTTYRGDELADFNNNISKFVKTQTAPYPGAQPTTTFDEQGAFNFFRSYQGGRLLPIANAYIKNNKTFSVLSGDEKKLINATENLSVDVNKMNAVIRDTYANHVATFSPKYAAKVASLNMSNKADLQSVKGFLSAKAYQKTQLGSADVKNIGDYSDALGEIINKPGTLVNLESRRDGTATLFVTDAEGKTYKIPALANELAAHFPAATQGSAFQPIKDIILTSSGSTTNAANSRGAEPANAVNARFSGFNIPALEKSKYASIVRFDIEGDPSNIGDPVTDGYDLIMYVNDPKTGLWKSGVLNKGGYATESGVLNMWNSINTTAVEQAIKNWK